MKRLIEKCSASFIKPDGSPAWCTMAHVSFADIPNDLDLTGFDVNPINVLYPSSSGDTIPCGLQINNFDQYSNCIVLEMPEWIQRGIYEAHKSGLKSAGGIIDEMIEENQHIFDGDKPDPQYSSGRLCSRFRPKQGNMK